MSLIKNLSFIVILCGALTILVFAIILLTRSAGSYRFYYPDKDYKSLKTEQRRLDNAQSLKTPKEEKLIREYFLGPVRYDLEFPLSDKVKINNIWIINLDGKMSAVINFNPDFLDFVQSDRENAKWVLDGLLETLKAGTSIEKLSIYADDKPLRTKLGNWNLSSPIQLRNKIKK
ncbi:MAG: GerMN domain-containing protein [Brevinematales bacterium]|jgi:hypothetical protein